VEAGWAVFNIPATWWCLHAFGLEGAAIAFLLTNLFHALIVYQMARGMTGFRWSADNLRAGSFFLLACLTTFVLQRSLPQIPALVLGALITLGSAAFCFRTMLRLTGSGGDFYRFLGTMRLGRKR
jgi:PST family polysaccharide transporter